MKEIRVGVVGVGHLGNYHLQKYRELSNCRIVGVVDIKEERAQKAAEMYDCFAVSDYRKLMDSVDAVSIAVPTVSHYRIAKDFLEAGVDV
ncbi:MAG: Gfo/Idh/MocA family protein, partial [Syntrophales bacterium]